jgi:hypothetical protein
MPMPTLTAQSVSIRTAGGALGVHAPEFAFIEGAVLNRLRDGQSVQLELTMLVLARPDGPTLAEARQRYRLSFDLWEERIAVTRVATPPRAVSHLRPRDAEAWCLENLTVPLGATGRKAKEPFWIRLVFQAAEEPPAQESSSEVSLLHTMIDKLSGRRSAGPLSKSMDAGPFSLSD